MIDANVLVSAVFGGAPEQAVRRAFEEEVWMSPVIQRELQGLGAKLSGKLTFPQLLRWNASFLPLIGKMHSERVRRRVRLSRDPKDGAYLSLASAVRADYLITGDKDLLSLPPSDLRAAGLTFLSIVTPREFLDRIGDE